MLIYTEDNYIENCIVELRLDYYYVIVFYLCYNMGLQKVRDGRDYLVFFFVDKDNGEVIFLRLYVFCGRFWFGIKFIGVLC